MELLILDSQKQVVHVVDGFISLRWRRCFEETGYFSLVASEEDYKAIKKFGGYYLTSAAHSEVGLIETMSYESASNSCVIRGPFLEKMLEDLVLKGPHGEFDGITPEIYEGTPFEVTHKWCSEAFFYNALLDVNTIGNWGDISCATQVSVTELGGSLLTRCRELLLPEGYSLRMKFVYSAYLYRMVACEIYTGIDRSIDQDINKRAVFSLEEQNIETSAFHESLSDYKNMAIVIGPGEGTQRKMVLVDQRKIIDKEKKLKEPRREVFVDAKNINNINNTQVYQEMKAVGKAELQKYQGVIEPKATYIPAPNLIYKKDFDLGDICSYQEPLTGIWYNQRITEIEELYEGGTHVVEPFFGKARKARVN